MLGLAYVLAFKRTALYETMGILIFSSIIHFFTTPYLMLYQTFGKLNANLEGTGRVLGVPPFRLFANVFLPQCAETLLDMFSYFFLNAMVTISAVSFLATAQTRPLSMLVTQYSDQINPEGAARSVLFYPYHQSSGTRNRIFTQAPPVYTGPHRAVRAFPFLPPTATAFPWYTPAPANRHRQRRTFSAFYVGIDRAQTGILP